MTASCFQPEGHGLMLLNAAGVGLVVRNIVYAGTKASSRVTSAEFQVHEEKNSN